MFEVYWKKKLYYESDCYCGAFESYEVYLFIQAQLFFMIQETQTAAAVANVLALGMSPSVCATPDSLAMTVPFLSALAPLPAVEMVQSCLCWPFCFISVSAAKLANACQTIYENFLSKDLVVATNVGVFAGLWLCFYAVFQVKRASL